MALAAKKDSAKDSAVGPMWCPVHKEAKARDGHVYTFTIAIIGKDVHASLHG
jgi:hypothetical protein